MELALLLSYSPSWVSVTVSWQDFSPLLSFIFVVGIESAVLAFWEQFPVILHVAAWKKYMHSCRTVKFPKSGVSYLCHQTKGYKSKSDLKDCGLKILLCRWVKSRDTACAFFFQHTDLIEEWWTWLIPRQPRYETLLVSISLHIRFLIRIRELDIFLI